MENAAKKFEWAGTVQHALVCGEDSLVKKITYADACCDHWKAWQKAAVSKYGGQAGGCTAIFSNMSWGQQRYDSLCSPQTVLCRTVVASTRFVQDKVDEAAFTKQRDCWQRQLDVMDGKSWILRGMLTDLHCSHRDLQVRPCDHEQVDQSIQPGRTRKFNYNIIQFYLRGGILCDMNAGTWTANVLQQLPATSKPFVGKIGRVHTISIHGLAAKYALAEMETIVVCILKLNDAAGSSAQHSNLFECMDSRQ